MDELHQKTGDPEKTNDTIDDDEDEDEDEDDDDDNVDLDVSESEEEKTEKMNETTTIKRPKKNPQVVIDRN